MKFIRAISTIHALWGAALLVLSVPRPFGALEPYFSIAPPFYTGIILLIAGVLPLLAMRGNWLRCLFCAVVPQQMLLCWALYISTKLVWETGDVRTIFALCYWGPMTYYHLREGIDLAIYFFWKTRVP